MLTPHQISHPQVPAGVDVTTNEFIIHGDFTVNGSVTVSGTITSGGDQIAGAISTQNHTHSGVETGGGSTSKPQ